VLTGIGASEAVTHALEPWFRHELRIRTTQVPLSSFIADDVRMQGQTLVLLSQELSPNATLALARVREFQQALLITSLAANDPRLGDFRAAGGLVWTLPPPEEHDLLVRVMGPMAAASALVRLGLEGVGRELQPALQALPELVAAAQREGFALASKWPLEQKRAPLIATGWYAHCLELLAWTWMEAWWTELPATFDVLQVAHGPWQQRFTEAGPWLCFTRPDDAPGLWPRLEQMLPPQQSLVRVPATLPGPLALFEHLAFVQALLAGVLLRSPRDLTQWPGKGTDGPLYDLGK
jgi:creatinine amidohydrolase